MLLGKSEWFCNFENQLGLIPELIPVETDMG
jgi:hypothetical protein